MNTEAMIKTATAKADSVKGTIESLKLMKAYYMKACEVVQKFDGKVINARFENALNECINDNNARFCVKTNDSYSFELRVYGTSNNKWEEDRAIYSFYNYDGSLSKIGFYNKETMLTEERNVTLFNTEDTKRINASGWIEFFKSRADLMQTRIDDRTPFADVSRVLKSMNEVNRIDDEIQALNDAKHKAMPYFLR